MTIRNVAIIGPGRVGLSLARALVRSECAVAVLGRHAAALPPPLEPATRHWEPAIAAADTILITVPDDAIAEVALELARGGNVESRHVILHTSGINDRSVLAALEASGAGLGSWHPLQTFSRRSGEPSALPGCPAVIEGDARALATGRDLATMLHLRPTIEVDAEFKASYHAAAVFASNYLVVLAEIAARLARDAGAGAAAGTMFQPLMRRTVANLGGGPAAALTGPIARGDAGTVARHLAALEGAERVLYITLGREALTLARRAGLDAAAANEIERLLS